MIVLGFWTDPTDAHESRRLRGSHGRYTPVMRLAEAVLHQAMADLHLHTTAAEPRATAIRADVRRWFRSDEARRPYAFVWVCDVLGLDASAVRARVLEQRRAA